MTAWKYRHVFLALNFIGFGGMGFSLMKENYALATASMILIIVNGFVLMNLPD